MKKFSISLAIFAVSILVLPNVCQGVLFDSAVKSSNNTLMSAQMIIYYPGTSSHVWTHESSSGQFSHSVPEGNYDVLYGAYNNQINVLLEDVQISDGDNYELIIDRIFNLTEDYSITYAIYTEHAFSRAKLNIFYQEDDYQDLGLGLYVCHLWDFDARECNGEWERTDAEIYRGYNHIELYVNSFSAFSVMQESYCGDGNCDLNETSSGCPADCPDDSHLTRNCSENYVGICAMGTESFSSGEWSGCPTGTDEICQNGLDDDCDGGADENCAALDIDPFATANQTNNTDASGSLPNGLACSDGVMADFACTCGNTNIESGTYCCFGFPSPIACEIIVILAVMLPSLIVIIIAVIIIVRKKGKKSILKLKKK